MEDKRREWLRSLSEDELPQAHRKLSEVVGIEAAIALCEEWGGSTLYIPTMDAVYDAARRKLIRAEFARGTGTKRLARKYGTTERTVQRMVEDIQPKQVSIFDTASECKIDDKRTGKTPK